MCVRTASMGVASALIIALLAMVGGCGESPATPTSLLDVDALAGEVVSSDVSDGTVDGSVTEDSAGDGPNVRIDASTVAGFAPLTVRFRAESSTAPGREVVDESWSFADGEVGVGDEVYHTFVEAGVYAVGLSVSDSTGAMTSAMLDIVVLPRFTIVCEPEAAAGPAPLTLSFSTDSVESLPELPFSLEFQWDLGGGAVGSGPQVTHTYERPGTYTVTLLVALGLVTIESDRLQVTVGPPAQLGPEVVAVAGEDQLVSPGDLVQLDGSGSTEGPGTTYTWQRTAGPEVPLDDAGTLRPSFVAPDVNVDLVFALTVQADGVSATDSVTVTIVRPENQPPTANAGPDQVLIDEDGDGSEPVTLDASGSEDPDGEITLYRWTEDGIVLASGPDPTVQLVLPLGKHTIELIVIDDSGGPSEMGDEVVVVVNSRANHPPVADAGDDQTLRDDDGDGSEVVSLDGSRSYDVDGRIARYVWMEGDDVVADSASATSEVPLNVGTHTLTLVVTDNRSAQGTDEVVIIVNSPAQQAPVADAGPDQTILDSDSSGFEIVTLDGCASQDLDGTIIRYEWSEGDEVLAEGTEPMAEVELPVGTHIVTLTVTDDDGARGCDEVIIRVDTPVVNELPVADAGPDQTLVDSDGDGSETVVLDGSGSHDPDGTIIKYMWTKGEATLADTSNPQVSIGLTVGTHPIVLTVVDDLGATDQDTVVVTIDPQPGTLAVEPVGGLSSSGYEGGPFEPSSKPYTLRNTGGQAISWCASKTQNWVSLSKLGGSLEPNATDVVMVSINGTANGLGVGEHNDTVSFANLTNGDGNTSRSVVLQVVAHDAVVIAGHVVDDEGAALAGVTVGGLPGNPVTNASGDYSTTVDYGWSGTATPSKAGYDFAPASRTYTNVAGAQNAQNYTGTLQTFTIAGRVVDDEGAALAGVTVSGLPGNPVTNASGDYSATVDYGWSGTATPSKAGYDFAPASRAYTSVTGTQNAQNYTGTATGGGPQPMTTASRTSGVMPLGVFFDCIDDPDEPWTSDVVQPRGFDDHPTSITGVKITRVEYGTPLGNGMLSYNAAAQTLTWQGNGEAAGAAVDVSGGKLFALPSGGGLNLHVWVNPAELPGGNASDTIAIVNGGLNADWASFHYEWDFGDPGSGNWSTGRQNPDGSYPSKNEATGYVAAHVYEAAGTFTVTLTIIDDVDGEHVYTQDVQVLSEPPGGWTTYYVSSSHPNRSDANPGTDPEWPLETFAAGMSKTAQQAVRVLFRRGDAFLSTVGEQGFIAGHGPGYIGAYGSGSLPVIDRAHQWPIINGRSYADWRVDSLDMRGAGLAQYNAIYDLGYNGLVRNCVFSGVFNYAYGPTHDVQFLVSCAFDGCKYGTFVGSLSHLALLGVSFDNGQGSHSIRTYSSKTIIAHCVFGDLQSGDHAIKMCGTPPTDDPARYNIVSDNLFVDPGNAAWITSFGPENDVVQQYLEQVVIERNVWDTRDANPGKTCINSRGADKITVRNNLFIGHAGVVLSVNSSAVGRTWQDWHVLNNTYSYTGTSWGRFCSATLASRWMLSGNIVHLPNTDDENTHVLLFADGRSDVESDMNIFHCPGHAQPYCWAGLAYSLAAWQGLGLDTNTLGSDPRLVDPDMGNLRLLADSPGRDVGLHSPHVRDDVRRHQRPPESSDIGAFEMAP